MNSTQILPEDIRPSEISMAFAAKVAEVFGISEFCLDNNGGWLGLSDNQRVGLTSLHWKLAFAWSDRTGNSFLDFDIFKEQ